MLSSDEGPQLSFESAALLLSLLDSLQLAASLPDLEERARQIVVARRELAEIADHWQKNR